jgi:hypothetical protein
LALARRNYAIAERKIRRCVAAIEAGGGAGLGELTRRIKEIEADKDRLAGQIADLTARIAASTARRPDTEARLALWTDFGTLWEHLTDEERTEMMGLLVEKVEMETNERGVLHLLLSVAEVRTPPRDCGLSPTLGSGVRRYLEPVSAA